MSATSSTTTMSETNVDKLAFAHLSDETNIHYHNQLAPKFPMVVTKPNVNYQDHVKKIDDEIKNKGFLPQDIEKIKLTGAKNLLIYFKTTEKYQSFLEKKTFLNGEIQEIRQAFDDKSIVIRGVNAEDLEEQREKLEKMGILEFKDIPSHRMNVKHNMVRATCNTLEIAEKYIKQGIKLGYVSHRVTKFNKRPSIIVCFNCSNNGHIASHCRKPTRCGSCSSTEHAKRDCKINKESDKANMKCPNCNGNHPASYAGCPKFKEVYENQQGLPTNEPAKFLLVSTAWSNKV